MHFICKLVIKTTEEKERKKKNKNKWGDHFSTMDSESLAGCLTVLFMIAYTLKLKITHN